MNYHLREADNGHRLPTKKLPSSALLHMVATACLPTRHLALWLQEPLWQLVPPACLPTRSYLCPCLCPPAASDCHPCHCQPTDALPYIVVAPLLQMFDHTFMPVPLPCCCPPAADDRHRLLAPGRQDPGGAQVDQGRGAGVRDGAAREEQGAAGACARSGEGGRKRRRGKVRAGEWKDDAARKEQGAAGEMGSAEVGVCMEQAQFLVA